MLLHGSISDGCVRETTFQDDRGRPTASAEGGAEILKPGRRGAGILSDEVATSGDHPAYRDQKGRFDGSIRPGPESGAWANGAPAFCRQIASVAAPRANPSATLLPKPPRHRPGAGTAWRSTFPIAQSAFVLDEELAARPRRRGQEGLTSHCQRAAASATASRPACSPPAPTGRGT